jgi:hypothetical protein
MANKGNKDPAESDDLEKQPEKPKKKSRWKRRIRIVLGLIVIALLASTFMLEYVTAGFHIVLPLGIEKMYRLPKNIQALELTNHPEHAARSTRIEKAAHIQTSDGFFVDVDVSILYRIADPFKVFTVIGPGNRFEQHGIIPQTEPKLKDAMGELTTEEFYNSPLRVEKTEAAKQILNEALTQRSDGRASTGSVFHLQQRNPKKYRRKKAQGPAGIQKSGRGPGRHRRGGP